MIKFRIRDEDNFQFEVTGKEYPKGFLSFEYVYALSNGIIVDTEIFTDTQYDKYFPDDTCIYLGYLEIRPEYRNRQYGSKLMEKFIEYFNNQSFTKTTLLNAQPYGSEPRLDTSDLEDFYGKYGFQSFYKDININIMLLTK